jgi:sugar O-acyltransferase (sialic acid O-acetyltransferase NeuD family)
MEKTLLIYCAGGLGKELLQLIQEINRSQNRWSNICFVDDYLTEKMVNDIKIYTFNQAVNELSNNECEFAIASGEPQLRAELFQKIKKYNYSLATLIHPNVVLPPDLKIGEGSIICLGTVITANVEIGVGTCIYYNALIHHDAKIGDNCFIGGNSTICGNVRIGSQSFIGPMTAIRDEITIGDNCVIGMGSVVLNDVESNSIAFGNPAKRRSENTKRRVFK